MRPGRGLLDGVDQWGKSLNPDLQTVSGTNGADTAWGAREDDVARQQCHVGGDETHQLCAVEHHLAGIGVLPQLAILKELNIQVVGVDLGFNVRAEWCERVERFGPCPLAFGGLDRSITDILGSGITEYVPGSSRSGDIAHFASNDDCQFCLKIGAVVWKRDFDLRAIGD